MQIACVQNRKTTRSMSYFHHYTTTPRPRSAQGTGMSAVLQIVLFSLLCFGQLARAAVYNSNGSSSDVQAKINLSADGDTVTIPAGSLTWSSGVTINNVGITLQGAGSNLTHIAASINTPVSVTCSAAHLVRVTGIDFSDTAASPGGMITFASTNIHSVDEVGFRLDNCKFTITIAAISGSSSRAVTVGGIYGLIDHCSFVLGVTGSTHFIDVNGSSISSDGGFTPWTRPLSLGTNKAVYIEDCSFDGNGHTMDSVVDGYSGCRVVFRHNTVLGGIDAGLHGTDSGGNRGSVSAEVYYNTYTNNTTNNVRAWTVRGGTGVFFNNTYSGTASWNGVTLQYFRAFEPQSGWQQCDGTVLQLGSTDLSSNGSRTCSTNGGVGFNSTDKETLGTWGGSFQRGFDGTGTQGYPGRDQPGIGPGQASEPIRIWNQTVGGGRWAGCSNCPDDDKLAVMIVANRDYFISTDASAARPGYTAYTYPHPLQGQGSPAPPQNLHTLP